MKVKIKRLPNYIRLEIRDDGKAYKMPYNGETEVVFKGKSYKVGDVIDVSDMENKDFIRIGIFDIIDEKKQTKKERATLS